MLSFISVQMLSDVRALYEHPSKWYLSYQENGTKYLKSRKVLSDHVKQQLNACAGEIYLCGIPPDVKAEKIAEIASLVGEVYILRYKVHFSGASRGFAYLQYINPELMQIALARLPLLFHEFSLPMIKVCKSRNSSKLLLRKTFEMTPMAVYETLKQLVNFDKLVGNELYHGYFEYQIIFKCNEEAVHARREILKSILKFGPRAVVVWDNTEYDAHGNRIRKPFNDYVHHSFNTDISKMPRAILFATESEGGSGGGVAQENLLENFKIVSSY